MNKYTEDDLREELKTKEYEYGFYTDIESDTLPIGLNEDIVRAISAKKEEPEWMTQWRLESFRVWQSMVEPEWANIQYDKPDFQAISYYSAPNKNQNTTVLMRLTPNCWTRSKNWASRSMNKKNSPGLPWTLWSIRFL